MAGLTDIKGHPIKTLVVGGEAYLATTIVDPTSGLPITDFGGGNPPQSFTKRIDVVSDNLIYTGEALAGTQTSAASWRIKMTTIASDGDVSITWADGDGQFDNIWDNHLTLSYS